MGESGLVVTAALVDTGMGPQASGCQYHSCHISRENAWLPSWEIQGVTYNREYFCVEGGG